MIKHKLMLVLACAAMSGLLLTVLTGGGEPAMRLVKRFPKGTEVSGTPFVVAFSPDDKVAFYGGYDGVVMWDTSTLTKIGQFGPVGRPGTMLGIELISVLPSGKLVMGYGNHDHLEIWDYTKRTIVSDISDIRRPVSAIVVSEDGKYLFAGTSDYRDGGNFFRGDYAIHMYDLVTKKEIRKFEGHVDRINGLAISNDGEMLLSYSADTTTRLWNVANASELKRDVPPGGPEKNSSETNTSLIDLHCPIIFSPDGKYFIIGMKKWDVQAWKVVGKLSDRSYEEFRGIESMAISADGKRLLCGHEKGELSLWDFTTCTVLCHKKAYPRSSAKITSVALTKDGKTALVGGPGWTFTGPWQSADDGYCVGLWKLPD